MTANERMNKSRYAHFINNHGRSPFSKGPIMNVAEFFECGCGVVQPQVKDWMTSYDLDRHVEHQPLLRHKDANQYV